MRVIFHFYREKERSWTDNEQDPYAADRFLCWRQKE